MGPSLQIFVPFVLELVLAALVKLNHLVSDVLRERLVSHVFNCCLLELVSHDCKRLRLGRRRDLFHKIVTERVLIPRILQENRIGSNVEHTIITLNYIEKVAVIAFAFIGLMKKKTYQCFVG